MSSGWILTGVFVGGGLGSIGLSDSFFFGSGFFLAASVFFTRGKLLAPVAFGAAIFLTGALGAAGFFGAVFEVGVFLTAAFLEAVLEATALATLFFAGAFLVGSAGFLAFFDVFARGFALVFVEDFVEVFFAEGTVQTPSVRGCWVVVGDSMFTKNEFFQNFPWFLLPFRAKKYVGDPLQRVFGIL